MMKIHFLLLLLCRGRGLLGGSSGVVGTADRDCDCATVLAALLAAATRTMAEVGAAALAGVVSLVCFASASLQNAEGSNVAVTSETTRTATAAGNHLELFFIVLPFWPHQGIGVMEFMATVRQVLRPNLTSGICVPELSLAAKVFAGWLLWHTDWGRPMAVEIHGGRGRRITRSW